MVTSPFSRNYASRFDGIQRLYGQDGLQRLHEAHVCVVGVGGVGSWVVEGLARSGIGALSLVDLDDVCISNVNRQLPALTGSFGKPKVDVLAERVETIQPDCRITPIREFFTPGTADRLLDPAYDFVVDAIDDVSNKCLLIARCREKGRPVLTTGGAGGRRNPAAIEITDLSQSHHDGLLQEVRKQLRRQYGFPRERDVLFDVPCVFSSEPAVYPQSDGTVCDTREADSDLRLDCQSGYGTASFVTGAFGFAAAAEVVRRIAEEKKDSHEGTKKTKVS